MRFILYVLMSAFIFSCTNQTKTSEEGLRFDGIYQTGELKDNGGSPYRHFFRFYKDGAVISVSSSGTADQIRGWFKKGHEGVDETKYELQGKEVNFTITGTNNNGVIKYNGTVGTNSLQLHSVSPALEKDEAYSFIAD
jgi:hypothetical protein